MTVVSQLTSSACFLLLFVLCYFLIRQNLTTSLLVVTQGILFQKFFPTLVNMFVVIVTLVHEAIHFNWIVISRIIKQLGNLIEFSRFEQIISIWAEVTLLGIHNVRTISKYPPCTTHCGVLGQCVGFSGERISFGTACGFGTSSVSCGYSPKLNLIS